MHGYLYGNGTLGSAYASTPTRTDVGRYTIVFGTALNSTTYGVLLQGEIPYAHLHVAARTRNTATLEVLDLSVNGKREVPYVDTSFSYAILC